MYNLYKYSIQNIDCIYITCILNKCVVINGMDLFFLYFKQNTRNESVMKKTVPIAVKFLDKRNNEIIRNLSSYLALAAIDCNGIIADSASPIIRSILDGL